MYVTCNVIVTESSRFQSVIYTVKHALGHLRVKNVKDLFASNNLKSQYLLKVHAWSYCKITCCLWFT